MKNLTKIAREYEALDNERSKRNWVLYTTGIDFGILEAEKKIAEFLTDSARFKTVCRHFAKPASPEEERAARILHGIFHKHHHSGKANSLFAQIQELESQLIQLLNSHRARLGHREVSAPEISRLVSEHPLREARREAYLARAQVNQPLVDAGFLRLLELRKEYALACGAKDFLALRLNEDELPLDLFDSWRDDCRARTTRVREAELRWFENFIKPDSSGSRELDRLMPWDRSHLAGKICPHYSAAVSILDFQTPIEQIFADYGFDLSTLNLTFDVFPRKHKSEWGYNFPIRTGVDSRILANIDDRYANYFVLLHETAHGAHFLGLDKNETVFNLGVPSIIAESFANFFGHLSYERQFIEKVMTFEDESAYETFANLKHFDLLWSFNQLASAIFDQELYRREFSSRQEIDALYWEIRREVLGLEPFADEPPWGYVIHHTSAPVYLHNYLLGDAFTERLKHQFLRSTGEVSATSNRDFGKFWRDNVLVHSGRYSFVELYQRLFAEPIQLAPFLDHCLRSGQRS